MRGQRHHADDPVSSSQQLRCGVVYTDTTHGAQGTRQQQPPTAAGSFWDSRNARKYLIGTLDHMRHWPSLPLGWSDACHGLTQGCPTMHCACRKG